MLAATLSQAIAPVPASPISSARPGSTQYILLRFPVLEPPNLTDRPLAQLARPSPCPAHLVHVGPVVVLTTSETSTTGMFPVLSDTSVTGGDVTPVFSGVGESGGHLE